MNGVTCFIGGGVNGIVFPGVGVALGGVACVFVVLVAVMVVLVLLVLFVSVFLVLLVCGIGLHRTYSILGFEYRVAALHSIYNDGAKKDAR